MYSVPRYSQKTHCEEDGTQISLRNPNLFGQMNCHIMTFGGKNSHQRGTGEEGNQELGRRTVLKGFTTGAVGAAGIMASSGTAAADHPFPPSCAEIRAKYAVQSRVWPVEFTWHEDETLNAPSDASEVVIYIHGSEGDNRRYAETQAYGVRRALQEKQGYDHPVLGYKYDSGWNSTGLWGAEQEEDGDWDNSMQAAEDLAKLLIDYMEANPDTDIRLISHSQGCEVALECLDWLRTDGKQIKSVSMLGAQVETTDVTDGGRWHRDVRDGAENVYNFYSTEDAFMDFDHKPVRYLAVSPAEGETPANYEDIDVSASVGDHCEYMEPEEGSIHRVYEHFDQQTGGEQPGEEDDDSGLFGGGGPGFTLPAVGAGLGSAALLNRFRTDDSDET